MPHDHESHDRLPIGAGLVLIAWATCQFIANLHLHSSLLTAAVYHNLLDGLIALIATGLDSVGDRLRQRHWAKNVSPISTLSLYLLIVILIGHSVIGEPPTRFTWGLAVLETLDIFVNLGVRMWARSSKSSLAQALGLHLLLDSMVAPTILVMSLLPIGKLYTGSTYLLVGGIAALVISEAREATRELHLHWEANCRDRDH